MLVGHRLGQPAVIGRARRLLVRARRSGAFQRLVGQRPVLFHIGRTRHQPQGLGEERLHHVVGLIGQLAGPDRHMRLAVFQPEKPCVRDQAHLEVRMRSWKGAMVGTRSGESEPSDVTIRSPVTSSPRPLMRPASCVNWSSRRLRRTTGPAPPRSPCSRARGAGTASHPARPPARRYGGSRWRGARPAPPPRPTRCPARDLVGRADLVPVVHDILPAHRPVPAIETCISSQHIGQTSRVVFAGARSKRRASSNGDMCTIPHITSIMDSCVNSHHVSPRHRLILLPNEDPT
jgi:hypothetical protein